MTTQTKPQWEIEFDSIMGSFPVKDLPKYHKIKAFIHKQREDAVKEVFNKNGLNFLLCSDGTINGSMIKVIKNNL